jgi:3-oxoacyl-[acyl-carrier-protein] synthase II
VRGGRSVGFAGPQARIAGWGCADDAHHVVRPHPEGDGILRAMRRAMARAGVGPEEIGYVNPHGTATPPFDTSEARALHRAGLARAAVSSTKALHGHALEASGVLELIVTVIALRNGLLPVNANFTGPDPDCPPLDLVLDTPRRTTARRALSLNSGIGGTCAALVVEVCP